MAKKVMFIGIDCATPQFLFGDQRFDLPHLRALAERGAWGRLESCTPPITVPAWTCMFSGRDPGELGCYGFRNRPDYSYAPLYTHTAHDVPVPRLWDLAGQAGKSVIVLGVPQTFPVSPVNGCLVAGPLTPDTSVTYTHPESLHDELERECGGYVIDVDDFRNTDRVELMSALFRLMHNRFDIAEYLLRTKAWELFIMVEIATDRLHHAFLRYADPAHPRYSPDHQFARDFRRFYFELDARIGALMAMAGDAAVIVASDHGATPMHGGFRVNQWLIEEGLLVLRSEPDKNTRIEECEIDWSRTKVWSTGGYYARLFINLTGREPQGTVSPGEYEGLRDRLIVMLESLSFTSGDSMGNKVHKPQDLYKSVNGAAPDLLALLGDLHWRAIGNVGPGSVFVTENDQGNDDANHAQHGVVLMGAAAQKASGELRGCTILDLAPTVLGIMGIPIPADMRGQPMPSRDRTS